MGQALATKRNERLSPDKLRSWARGRVFAHSRSSTFAVRDALSEKGEVSFHTEDNGSIAFDVSLRRIRDGLEVRVRRIAPPMEALKLRAREVWLGQGEYEKADADVGLGCAVLCVVAPDEDAGGSELVLVSNDVRSLGPVKERERVEEFVATLCNSRVVYGYVRTNLRLIFPASMNCCPRGSKEYSLDARRWDYYADKTCVLGSGDDAEYVDDVKGEDVLIPRWVRVDDENAEVDARGHPVVLSPISSVASG